MRARLRISLVYLIIFLVLLPALLILTPLSFEVVAGAVLAWMVTFELMESLLQCRRRDKADVLAHGQPRMPLRKRLFWAAYELGAITLAAGLMYFLVDFSALASLLVVAIGVASAVSFWRLNSRPMFR